MLEIKLGYSWNYKGQRGGEALFHTAIQDFSGQIADWKPAFTFMAHDVLEYYTEQMFATEGHGEWQSLAEATYRQKKSTRILFRTGELQESFHAGGPQHVEEISAKRLLWGSTNPVAVFAQTGTGKGFQRRAVLTGKGTGRGMPQRRILELSEDMKRAMRSAMVRRAAQVARMIGFKIASDAGEEVSAADAGRMGRSFLRTGPRTNFQLGEG